MLPPALLYVCQVTGTNGRSGRRGTLSAARDMRAARIAGAVALVWAAGAAACHARPGLPARHYDLHGTVIAVDRDREQLVVQHDNIPGFMSAMTMPYAVGNAQDLVFVEIGDEIRGEVVDSAGSVHLGHITVLTHAKVKPAQP
ncbi:MAG TPA: copper-binding protein [Gemmatimonadales bacterium]|nr:copper-binding protein [Gemmatimonadales bacterium]